MLVLELGGVSRLSARTTRSLAIVRAFIAADLWPAIVPSMVLVESLQGHGGRDAHVKRLLKTCIVETAVNEALTRRAAEVRRRARRGSAVDALVVAMAEPGGTVVTGDKDDIEALAAQARDVTVAII